MDAANGVHEMKQFTVAKICGFAAGTLLELGKEQVRRRRSVLSNTDTDGVYLTNQPVQFKVGEVVGVDPDLAGKGMLDALISEDTIAEPEPKSKPGPKPKSKPGK